MNQYAQERTIVDEFVKDKMLKYFSLFPTRKHVLVNLFYTVGNGYEWEKQADGFSVPVCGLAEKEERRIPTHEEAYGKQQVIENDPVYAAAQKADLEFQDMVRDWARRHIDAISTQWFHFYDFRLPAPEPYESCGRYSLLATLPENIHPAWVDAIDEVCDHVLAHINSKTNAHCFDDEAKRCAYLQSKHSRYWETYRVTKAAIAVIEELPMIKQRRRVSDELIDEVLRQSDTH